MIDWILEPLQFGFMNRALLVTVVAAITCAMLSCWLVQIGWALMGDAVSHAVLPGVVLSSILNLPFAFDPSHANAIGISTRRLSVMMLGMLALTVVVALQAVGIVLVVAMVITPVATAYLLTKSFDRMLLISVVVTAFASVVGVYASYYLDVSTGGAVVLAQAAAFVIPLPVWGARGSDRWAAAREENYLSIRVNHVFSCPTKSTASPTPIMSTPPVALSAEIRCGDRANQSRAAPAARAQMLSEISAITTKTMPSMKSCNGMFPVL